MMAQTGGLAVDSNLVLSQAIKEKIVGAKTVVLPNAGHMTFADQTAIFVNAVDGFVNGKTN
ncbi:MAG TPA: hypothetical protein VKB61_07015 [Candidatus Acidoferrum sp.]|jgi:pimeloyl-ACP methyl ester carboxylesterase|nr:hypothetical protein [Candidatus Acidoferrum sp.]